jgi:hypothetical protein
VGSSYPSFFSQSVMGCTYFLVYVRRLPDCQTFGLNNQFWKKH